MTSRPAASAASAEVSLRAPQPGRILIVDDRLDKLATLTAVLAPLGHEIVTAGSGREALRWLLRFDFAVVLLDMNMPGMSGFEAARLIRLRRRNQDTPIIFVTSYGDDIHAIEGYSLGAVDFILSPVVPDVLRSKVSVFLKLHDRTTQVRQQSARLLQRTEQMQRLTRASLEIHAALSIEQTLQVAADAARDVIGARWSGLIVMASRSGLREHQVVLSPAQEESRPGQSFDPDLAQVVVALTVPVRLTAAEITAPALRRLFPAAGCLASSGLASPLLGRDGSNTGLLVAAGKREGDFSDDDLALLVQLAQMASTALENTLSAEARESNRIKDEFLATLSHELRTPLSSILGWTQLLRTQMLDPDEAAEALEIIERNAEMQCRLIEDLLDISRIVTGKMHLHVRPLNLAKLIHTACGVILPAAQARQIQIDLALDDCNDSISGDADRLQQVLWNVLSNAVKFTPVAGRINVSLGAADGQAEIRVRDNGEGIAPDFLPHMFDGFRQADGSTSRRHGGLGLGLGIVRHVLELHGGTVWAESEGKGRGTTIVMKLPLAGVPETGCGRPAGCAARAPELRDPGGAAPECAPAAELKHAAWCDDGQ